MDGILRAVVVAGHAVGAVAVPSGMSVFHCDIVEGTGTLAEATGDAAVVDMELAVGNQETVEQGIRDVGVKPWHLAPHHIEAFVATKDALCHFWKQLLYTVDFALFTACVVELEGFEVDVCLWHDERVCKMEGPTQVGSELGKPFSCSAHIVATGAGQIEICRRMIDCESFEIGFHHTGHSPGVDRAYNSERLVGSELERRLRIGHVHTHQIVVGEIGQLLGNEFAVSTAREKEYHKD